MNSFERTIDNVKQFIICDIQRIKSEGDTPENRGMLQAYKRVLSSMGIPDYNINTLISKMSQGVKLVPNMNAQFLKELISDKEKFIDYVGTTVVTKETNVSGACENHIYKDSLGRIVIEDCNDYPMTRRYTVYPTLDETICIVFYVSDNKMTFVNADDKYCTQEAFFTLLDARY